MSQTVSTSLDAFDGDCFLGSLTKNLSVEVQEQTSSYNYTKSWKYFTYYSYCDKCKLDSKQVRFRLLESELPKCMKCNTDISKLYTDKNCNSKEPYSSIGVGSSEIKFANGETIKQLVRSFFAGKQEKVAIDSFEDKLKTALFDAQVSIPKIQDELLFKCVQQGNIDNFMSCLTKFNKTAIIKHGTTNQTLLHPAAAYGNLPMIRFLVARATSFQDFVNAKDTSNKTALHYAVEHEQTEAVGLLVELGVNVNSLGPSNQTPIHFAVIYNKKVDALNLLIANANAALSLDSSKLTPVDYAIKAKRFDMAELLVNVKKEEAKDVAPAAASKTSLVPLTTQLDAQLYSLLKSKPDSPDSVKPLLLFHYAGTGNCAMVQQVVEDFGISVFAKDVHGKTALHIAAGLGALETVVYLLSKVEEKKQNLLEGTDNDGQTALMQATINQRENVVDYLTANQCNVYAYDKNGDTALHHAVNCCKTLAIVEKLISKDARVMTNNSEGKNVIDIAISLEKFAFLPLLLKAKLAQQGKPAPIVVKKTIDLPESCKCPITHQIMNDPVILVETGHTYERSAIEAWLAKSHTCPKTNTSLLIVKLFSNHTVKQIIAEWKKMNA